MTKIYQSANMGPQPGEPLCDGADEPAEVTNNAPKTDVPKWKEQLAALNSAADATSLRAYPPKK